MSESTISTSTPQTSNKKRHLTSPDFPVDLKKNRVFEIVAGAMATEDATAMVTEPDEGVKLGLVQIHQIANMLRDSFKEDMKETINEQLPGIAKEIVSGVIDGLTTKINNLESDNEKLKKENKELKAQVKKIEKLVDAGEQYSRRNSLRMSGVAEVTGEDTDKIVMDRADAVSADISLDDIDRSHRVGKHKPGKTRDIIIKFATYRARQKFYSKRKGLKDAGYAGVFLNEDLTKQRMNLLYKARMKVKSRCLKGAWSSDGTILIKENDDEVVRVTCESDLSGYNTPREEDITDD